MNISAIIQKIHFVNLPISADQLLCTILSELSKLALTLMSKFLNANLIV